MFALQNGLIVVVTLIALASAGSTLVAVEQASRGQTQMRAAPQVLQWEKLTEQQFKTLPDTQPIVFEGKQTTLGDVRAKLRIWQQQTLARRSQNQAKAKAAQSQAVSRAQASIRAFEQEQQRKIAADTAAMQAELARLRQQYKGAASGQQQAVRRSVLQGRDARTTAQIERIRKEAIELHGRSRTASPAQKQALDRRATELLAELRQLGVQIQAPP